ncbi:MAG: energy-coupling factor transporter ATPase, partial [Candidatus Bathyarchaeota archaeon]|nr:energy-coupling factor transporter ATPase [Candidatus Bathyarchaeota archaeon]
MGIVEVKDLWYTYPNAAAPALKGINLNIEEGEFILLTGPSGCGKTTFCRCLNGLVPHFYSGEMKGEINVLGLDTRKYQTMELARHVGLIFQNPDNQIFALTVEKDIAFGLENLGIPKKKMREEINDAAKLTDIHQLLQRGTHELSGGQKQRLTIAGILAMHPRIIVMDEPTSFLDPVGAEKIFEVLHHLNKEHGITIILIEHRLDLAVKYLDRIIIFNQGEVVNDGSPEKIFNDEKTRLIGVGIPRMVELSRRLKSHNYVIPQTPLNANQFYEYLKPFLGPEKPQIKKKRIEEFDEITNTQQNNPLIQINDLFFSYPSGVEAIKGVTLNISNGEYVAIMGENGAGKTTLVKHLNGLLKPKHGKIIIDGTDVSKVSVATLARKVGLVFQNPDDQLFAEDVEEELSFALRNFGFKNDVIKDRVEWALNLLDIGRYRKSSPFTLSGGERKRVALASVLAWNPNVLVLDEPTIGQD